MIEKNIPTKALLLRLSSEGVTGSLQLSTGARIGPATQIKLLREMEDEGLVRIAGIRSRRAGRPRTRVEVTPLGREFLTSYRELTLKSLRSRRADLRKAAADARYSTRLESRGLSLYDLFLETNEMSRIAGAGAL